MLDSGVDLERKISFPRHGGRLGWGHSQLVRPEFFNDPLNSAVDQGHHVVLCVDVPVALVLEPCVSADLALFLRRDTRPLRRA